MNVKPIGNRVLVKRLKPEEKTKNGLIIPNATHQRQDMGEIVAIGDKDEKTPISFEIGERILMEKYSGQEVTFETSDAEDYVIVPIDKIIAIVS